MRARFSAIKVMVHTMALGFLTTIAALLPVVLVQAFTPVFLAADDGYRHIATSREILKHGFEIAHTVPWLPLSFFVRHPSDSWFLYHLSLTSLAAFFSNETALRVAVVLTVFAALASFLVVLRALRIKYPALWVGLFIVGSGLFFYRLQLGRAYTVTLAFFLLALAGLVSEPRRRHLLAVAIVLGLLFHAVAIIIPVVAFAYIIFERSRDWKRDILLVLIATAVGLVARPHPLDFIAYLPYLAGIPLLANIGSGFSFGNEVYGLDPTYLAADLFLIVGVWIPSLAWAAFSWKTLDFRARFLTVASAVFGVGMLATVRLFDFWIPLALLATAVVASPAIEYVRRSLNRLLLILLSFTTLLFVSNRVYTTITNARDQKRPEDYRVPLAAIARDWRETGRVWSNSPNPSLQEGRDGRPLIMNSRWDIFPLLFAEYPSGAYVAGMDPELFRAYDEKLFWKWYHLSTDTLTTCGVRECVAYDDPVVVLRDDLNADYLLIDRTRNPNLYRYARSRHDAFRFLDESNRGASFAVIR